VKLRISQGIEEVEKQKRDKEISFPVSTLRVSFDYLLILQCNSSLYEAKYSYFYLSEASQKFL